MAAPRAALQKSLAGSQLEARLIDGAVVMELPPDAMRLDEPSRRTNSKLKPNGGSFAAAFFTSNEEVKVIITLRNKIAERHADSRWPVK
jgi:hypothetical protein